MYPSPVYMWQEQGNVYRFQTDRKDISKKLKRREGFRKVAEADNPSFVVYAKSYQRMEFAKRAFGRLCGFEPRWDSETAQFEASLKPYLNSQSEKDFEALRESSRVKNTSAFVSCSDGVNVVRGFR